MRVQAVLPDAIVTEFLELFGLPVQRPLQEVVMSAQGMVDASLSGLAHDERVTIPALADLADREAFEQARKAMGLHLSCAQPAPRYSVFRQ